MTSTYIPEIINAITASHPEAGSLEITSETRFSDIPGLDSMSIVDFQMELASAIGEKAETVQPILDMTISEYSEVLLSI